MTLKTKYVKKIEKLHEAKHYTLETINDKGGDELWLIDMLSTVSDVFDSAIQTCEQVIATLPQTVDTEWNESVPDDNVDVVCKGRGGKKFVGRYKDGVCYDKARHRKRDSYGWMYIPD